MAGVQPWVGLRGEVRPAGFTYRVPVVLAGEPVEYVAADHLARIYHRHILVGCYPQRRKPGELDKRPVQGHRTQGDRGPDHDPDRGLHRADLVRRHHVPRRASLAGKPVQVSIVAGSVQPAFGGQVVRGIRSGTTEPKEHGAFAVPHGRPRKVCHDAPDGAGAGTALSHRCPPARDWCRAGAGAVVSCGYRYLTTGTNGPSAVRRHRRTCDRPEA